ncbi:MAG: DUF4157 domain-containing protein [Saprospirales bacterium]|nr:DUF4157 domain-containing protein [Saprospirales bacterium]
MTPTKKRPTGCRIRWCSDWNNPMRSCRSKENANCEQEEESLQQKPLANLITPLIQRQQDGGSSPRAVEDLEEQDKEETTKAPPAIQQKSHMAGGMTAPPALAARLQATKGGGRPLPGSTRSQMESGFGTDFSSVRIHTDSQAVQLNQELGAQAFTHGRDVYFGAGRFQPETRGGEEGCWRMSLVHGAAGKTENYSDPILYSGEIWT